MSADSKNHDGESTVAQVSAPASARSSRAPAAAVGPRTTLSNSSSSSSSNGNRLRSLLSNSTVQELLSALRQVIETVGRMMEIWLRSLRQRGWQCAVILGFAGLAVFALTQVAYRVQFSSSAMAADQTIHEVGVLRQELSNRPLQYFRHNAKNLDLLSSLGGNSTRTGTDAATRPKTKAERKAERRAKRKAEKKRKKQLKQQRQEMQLGDQPEGEKPTARLPPQSLNDVRVHEDPTDADRHSSKGGQPNSQLASDELVDCTGRHFQNSACTIHSFSPQVDSRTQSACEAFLHDGLCDVGQYATDSGRPSPNLNCSKFNFDNGVCINMPTDKARLKVREVNSLSNVRVCVSDCFQHSCQ